MFSVQFKNVFNKLFSKKYGWSPPWFFAKGFDRTLIKRIKVFQKSIKLYQSGICGPKTYKYILLHRLQNISKRKTNYNHG